MAITDVDSCKRFIAMTNSAVLNTPTENAWFDEVVPAVDSAIKKYLDRVIEEATYTEYYSGNNTKVLVLNEFPVLQATNVTGVWQDDDGCWGQAPSAFDTSTAMVQGTDYAVVLDGVGAQASTARLYNLTGFWHGRFESRHGLLTAAFKPGAGNIKVTYKAGYASGTIPKDIQLAFWQIVAQIRFSRQRGLLPQSESLAEYAFSLQQMIQNILQIGTPQQLLSRYRRIRNRYPVLG